jgi:hypothetical protein
VVWSKPRQQFKLGRLLGLLHTSIIIVSSKIFFFFFIRLKEYQGHHFESQLKEKDPLTLFAAFIVIVLNVFGALVCEWASTALKLQVELLRLAFSCQSGGITAYNEDLLQGFPQDIRTAQKLLT